MKSTPFINSLLLIMLAYSCTTKPQDETSDKANLLFKSGFEEGVYFKPEPYEEYEDYISIEGTDSETGYTWPINILGATYSSLHYVDSDNFQAIESEIQTVVGHNGEETKALYNIQHYNTESTQCPYEILDITEGRKDLYVKYWIKLDAASLTQPDMWRTFFEWKTKDYADETGFRLISFVYTDADGVPYWHWQGDTTPTSTVWEIDNKTIPVPLNEWFSTEFYWHWSEGADGRALWKVNGQVIGDHYGPTTVNSKPIDFIMLTQIYGNVNPKHQWVDDIEIWDGIPE